MSSTKSAMLRVLALLCGLTLLAAACGDDAGEGSGGDAAADPGAAADAGTDAGELSGSINISGSSTVAPISTLAAQRFEEAHGDVSITVDGPGTGDGFALFCTGETDISDASRPIAPAEAEDCAANGVEYVELEVAFDGIAVMTNPANESIDCLTFGDLYALMGPESEEVGNWSEAQPLADELGSTATFPDAELVISAPGPESGTYDSFIEIVLEPVAEQRGVEADPLIRTDFSGSANDNTLIQGIAGADTSFGWVGFAYADENADVVKVLQVDDGETGCVAPTVETIADGSYPVSRSLYIYVNTQSAQRPEVAAYVDSYLGEFYVEAVTKAFGDTGYVALPDERLAETVATWESR